MHSKVETESRPVAARGDLSAFEQSSVRVFETVAPSVVQVGVLSGGDTVSQSGTGFVWDTAGHIVTNNHVVEGGNTILVRFSTGEVAPAELRGTAPGYDLAVLRIERSAAHPPPVPLGSAADLKVGQVVLTYNAAAMKDAGRPRAEVSRAASAAKLFTSEAAMRATRTATQVFGGYGFMEESPVARFYRDAKILEIGEGTSEVQRMVIARSLGLPLTTGAA